MFGMECKHAVLRERSEEALKFIQAQAKSVLAEIK